MAKKQRKSRKKQLNTTEGVHFFYKPSGAKAPAPAMNIIKARERGLTCAYDGDRLRHVKNDPKDLHRTSRDNEKQPNPAAAFLDELNKDEA